MVRGKGESRGRDVLAEGGESRMRVAGVPDQRVRVRDRRVTDRDAAQVVAFWPGELHLLADERGDVGGVGDHVPEGLGAEVRVRPFDAQVEGGG
jgi:hypothetical protein